MAVRGVRLMILCSKRCSACSIIHSIEFLHLALHLPSSARVASSCCLIQSCQRLWGELSALGSRLHAAPRSDLQSGGHSADRKLSEVFSTSQPQQASRQAHGLGVQRHNCCVHLRSFCCDNSAGSLTSGCAGAAQVVSSINFTF